MTDIYSKAVYPANHLSNFAPHSFVLDGIDCRSMEGFLQSLKYRNPEKQSMICLLTGAEAKNAGIKKHLWKITKRVYWKGNPYGLFSDDLQKLIDRAYFACFEQCEEFRNALQATENDELTHSIGKTDMRQTILTEYNYVRRLYYLRTLSYRL